MFRIGEFSILSNISINMLRHYDKIGVLVPSAIDEKTGYRYYTKEQFIVANRIIALKAMGFALQEIKDMNRLNSEEIKEIMKNKLEEIKQERDKLDCQIKQINEIISSKENGKEYNFTVAVKTIPKCKVVSYRDKIAKFNEEGKLWTRLYKECAMQGVQVIDSNYSMAVQHAINEKDIDVEVQLIVERLLEDRREINFYEIPEREVASFIYKGSYDKLTTINNNMIDWISKNEYEVYEDKFFIYHVSPKEDNNKENFITEVCYPIRKRK